MWADSSSVGPGPCLFSAKVPLCLLCVLQYSFFLSVYHVFFSTVFFLIEVKLVYKHYIPIMLLSGIWFFATHALQPARFMGFSRQEHWSELPFPSPEECCSVVSDSLRPMPCSPPGSWDSPGKNTGVAISFSRGSSWPRDQTRVSCIAGWFFTLWAIREARSPLVTSSHCRLILYPLSYHRSPLPSSNQQSSLCVDFILFCLFSLDSIYEWGSHSSYLSPSDLFHLTLYCQNGRVSFLYGRVV